MEINPNNDNQSEDNDMIVYFRDKYEKKRIGDRVIVNDIFDLYDKVGKGSFWTVSLVKRNLVDENGLIIDDNYYVFKEGKLSKTTGDYFNSFGLEEDSIEAENEHRIGMKEYNILNHVNHPNIARLYECIVDSERDKIVFVMEYCDLGTVMSLNSMEDGYVYNNKILSTLLNDSNLNELTDFHFSLHHSIIVKAARIILKQLCDAVKYLHGKNIIHLDIKPDNILMKSSDRKIKLSDFSAAKELKSKEDKIGSTQGTGVFMSIEIQEMQEKYDPFKVDIYNIGTFLYVYLMNKFDFDFSGEEGKLLKELYPSLYKLLTRLLHSDYRLRPTIEEVMCDEFLQLA